MVDVAFIAFMIVWAVFHGVEAFFLWKLRRDVRRIYPEINKEIRRVKFR